MSNNYSKTNTKLKSVFRKARFLGMVALLFGIQLTNTEANNFKQSPTKINVQMKNESLLDLFEKIQAQSDFLIVYNDAVLESIKNKKVSISTKDMDVLEVLDKVAKANNFSYEVSGRQIVILPAKSTSEKSLIQAVRVAVQDRQIRGVIQDETGEALPGVTILVKGTTKGTTTDIDGNYVLEVPDNAVLVVSYIGFNTQEVVVGNQSTINITLQSSLSDLSEFVVTGYGVQEKRAITGAMSSIKGEVIENFPVASFDRALHGQISGVNVMAANGVPGGPVQIQIRGVGSITAGSQPLIIVDGVQLNTSTSSANTASNPLAFLNNNDIESIEVLKDGAAASIYGAQAANGVILVTTKKGKAGKTQFNFNYFTGITEPMPQVAMMSSQQFLDARITARINRFPTRTDAANNHFLYIRFA